MIVDNNFIIRLAKNEDLEEIITIWFEGLSYSFDTTLFEKENLLIKFRDNFFRRAGIFNYWVAIAENNNIVGWQSLNKCTVNPIKENEFAESSTYIHKDFRKNGIGEMLLNHVCIEAEKSSLLYIIAYISAENKGAVLMTNKLGFITVGEIPNEKKSKNIKKKLFIIKPI